MEQTHVGERSRSSAALLERERERRLFLRAQRFGDEVARRRLIESFMPLARHLAHRYQRGNEPTDDLVQVASIGLVKAVDRFDASRGTAFSTYAVPTILGELKRYFRDAGWAVHVPRGAQERALRVGIVIGRLSRELGRSPAPTEIAEASGLTQEEVAEAIEAGAAARPESLDRVHDGGGSDPQPVIVPIACDEEGYELVEERDAVERGLRTLPERERTVVRLRFEEELTQSQIAERVGISQMQVSRVIRSTLETLRLRAGEAPASRAGSEARAKVAV